MEGGFSSWKILIGSSSFLGSVSEGVGECDCDCRRKDSVNRRR